MNKEISNTYERMWVQFQSDMADGKSKIDLPPSSGDLRWGVSLVLRLAHAKKLVDNLSKEVEMMTPLVGSNQLFYGEDTFHTTVRSIEAYRELETDDEKILRYKQILNVLSKEFGSIIICYVGLTAGGATIMAQGWPTDDTLYRLRCRFDSELKKEHLQGGLEKVSLRKTAHSSLIVLTEMIQAPSKLLFYISDNRKKQYGYSRASKIELVRYIRTKSNVSIIPLMSVDLG
jgi:hypothetical protein